MGKAPPYTEPLSLNPVAYLCNTPPPTAPDLHPDQHP